VLTGRIGNPPLEPVDSGYPEITRPFAEHDYYSSGNKLRKGRIFGQDTYNTRNERPSNQSTKPCPVGAAHSIQLLSAAPRGSDYLPRCDQHKHR
jgi:hypothetical protein